MILRRSVGRFSIFTSTRTWRNGWAKREESVRLIISLGTIFESEFWRLIRLPSLFANHNGRDELRSGHSAQASGRSVAYNTGPWHFERALSEGEDHTADRPSFPRLGSGNCGRRSD